MNINFLTSVLKQVSYLDKIEDIQVSQCNNIELGDYQTNVALKCFKQVRSMLNLKKPIDFAELIVAEVNNNKYDGIKSISCSFPGFINIKLSDNFIMKQALLEINNKSEGVTIVDYSSPNIAKEMHVGHLRSTIIGDVISNILVSSGENVIRINHIGDWGTQFGMLIQYLEHMNIDIFGSNIELSDLHKWYKESKKVFDSDEEFNNEAHKKVVKLQSGDINCIKIWKKLCYISESSYKKIYRQLGVSDDLKTMGESFYNDYFDSLIDELESKGLLVDEDGAKLLFPIHNKPPLIVKKSDGGYGYDTTDLAALRYRINNMGANKIVYVTDSGQSLHFELLFEAAKKAGWLSNNIKLSHVGFGIVLGEDGKRIKSRSGDSIKLRDLIEEANDKFITSNKERLIQGAGQMNIDNIEKLSKIIGSGAIKYADLKQNRNNNYQFSFEKMLDHKGDTIIYLLYSWVRIKNLLEKTKVESKSMSINNKIDRKILLYLSQFDEMLYKTRSNLLPNYLCEYLFNLSNLVNEYWNTYKVLGDTNEESMITMFKMVLDNMRKCFTILGINADNVNKL